jgi:hypothetical protein
LLKLQAQKLFENSVKLLNVKTVFISQTPQLRKELNFSAFTLAEFIPILSLIQNIIDLKPALNIPKN